MSTITRVNGSTYFADTYGNGSAVWDEIDDEINVLVSTVNALDNANIANTPKIDGSKVDFSLGGFVEDSGDEMTGPLEHIYDGIFRKMRASGNARLYEGTADALYVLSYNTEYSSGAWQGRDTTGICLKFTMEGDGFHLYGAASASSGTVPTWDEIFHINLSGQHLTDSINFAELKDGCIQGSILADEVTGAATTPYSASFYFHVYIPPDASTLEIRARVKGSAGSNLTRVTSPTVDGGNQSLTTSYVAYTFPTVDVSGDSGEILFAIESYNPAGGQTNYFESMSYRLT